MFTIFSFALFSRLGYKTGFCRHLNFKFVINPQSSGSVLIASAPPYKYNMYARLFAHPIYTRHWAQGAFAPTSINRVRFSFLFFYIPFFFRDTCLVDLDGFQLNFWDSTSFFGPFESPQRCLFMCFFPHSKMEKRRFFANSF